MTKHFYRAEVTLDSRVSLLETVVKHRLARRKGNSFRIKRLITNGGGGRIDRRVSIFEIEFPVKIELFIYFIATRARSEGDSFIIVVRR